MWLLKSYENPSIGLMFSCSIKTQPNAPLYRILTHQKDFGSFTTSTQHRRQSFFSSHSFLVVAILVM